MTRTTGNQFSDNLGSIWTKIDTYVTRIHRGGTLDSRTRVFLALALGQAVKQTGCSLRELCYLSDNGKGKVKTTLAMLNDMGVLKIAAFRTTIPTTGFKNIRVNIPSGWAKGKTIERSGGRPVPLYELVFAGRELIITTLESVERLTFEELSSVIENRVDKVSDELWQKYLRFGRIMLSGVRTILQKSARLYDELMTQELMRSVDRSLKALETIEGHLQERSYVMGLIEDVKASLTRLSLKHRNLEFVG